MEPGPALMEAAAPVSDPMASEQTGTKMSASIAINVAIVHMLGSAQQFFVIVNSVHTFAGTMQFR